jgi:hypothetical protein
VTFADENWRTKAACRKGVDPEVFFADGKGNHTHRRVEIARQICNGCPVLAACRWWVGQHPQEFGVWAGYTAAERRCSNPPGARYCRSCPAMFTVTVADPFQRRCPTCVRAGAAKRIQPPAGGFFCGRGHPLNESNQYVTPSGKKVCRRCNTTLAAERRETRKAGAS